MHIKSFKLARGRQYSVLITIFIFMIALLNCYSVSGQDLPENDPDADCREVIE